MSDSLGQAFLLLADIKHYAGCRDNNIVLKLQWHTVVVCYVPCMLIITLILLSLLIPMFLWCVFVVKCY